MVSKNTYKDLTWVDLESPKNSEIREVIEEYKIDPDIADILMSPSRKAKIQIYEDSIFGILHFPTFKHSHTDEPNQEIDFIVGKDFLVTVHYDSIDALHKFTKEFEVNSILEKNDIGEHAGFLLYYLLRKLYKSVNHELEYIEALLADIESKIFQGQEKEMVKEISEVSKVLLDFRKAIGNHTEILEHLSLVGKNFFGDDFSYNLETLNLDHQKISAYIEDLRDLMLELRQTNNSLLSTKQNEAMKVLTIMAFVTFPLSLIASIFGMNTSFLPIVGWENDFWIIVGIMAIMTLLFFAFFKHKKWL